MLTAAKSVKLLILTLLSAVLVTVTSWSIVNAASSKADFTLAITPGSQTVSQGSVAAYTVTMTPNNGYSKTAVLAAVVPSGSGLTTNFAPATVTSKSATSTLSVGTSSAATGTWTVTVSGSDGALMHTASATVTVQAAPQEFTLGITPPSAQVLPGDTAQYGVTIARQTGYTNAVSLNVSGLPAGGVASLSPGSPVSGGSTTLQVTTSKNTPTGTFTLAITGSGDGASNQTITTQLVVADKGKPFSINGAPAGRLWPGGTPTPIGLTVTNSNNQTINITNLTVSVTGTSAGGACGPSNFAITQFNGTYPLVLNAGATATLQQLGAPQEAWPTVQLINDHFHNQDACKNVMVYLSYTGAGQG